MRFFCLGHMRKKRMILVVALSFVGVLTLVAMFGAYAFMKAFNGDASTRIIIDDTIESSVSKGAKLLRNKRGANDIDKLPEHYFNADKNLIKRNTDNEDIENFLDLKYKEINKNDAAEEMSEEDVFIQKRSSNFKNSIRKLEKAFEANQELVKSLIGIDESEETDLLIEKDLIDVETEIESMDEDIVALLEAAKLTDNSIHKRIRHKRETEKESDDLNSVVLLRFRPILEEKKREKRLVQQKLAEARDEFIRCKKSAQPPSDGNCDGVYNKVMDRFREITRKFKEIEEIIDEMEHFNPSARSDEENERKKKKDKKKKKKSSEESEESEESSEHKKKKKTTAEMTSSTFTTEEATDALTTEKPTTLIETTTVDDDLKTTTMIPEDSGEAKDSAENRLRLATTTCSPVDDDFEKLIVPSNEPDERFESNADNSVTDPTVNVAPSSTCPAGAFSDNFVGHPMFEEDLKDPHAGHKFFQLPSPHTVDDFVSSKIQRSGRGPLSDAITDIFEDAGEIADGAKNLIDDVLDNNRQSAESQEVGKAQSSSSFKSSDANGEFMALCERMSKQSKQAQSPQQNFAPVPVPLSAFAGHFPATGETSKATSKVMMNPAYQMMPYPVCFVNYRPPQQQLYYPGLMPMTQPGGKVHHQAFIDPEFIRTRNSGGYFMPSSAANFRPIPVGNQFMAPNQAGYREVSEQPPQPTYCTFLASDPSNFPAYYSSTTEQPPTTSAAPGGKIEQYTEEPERSDDGTRANSFNIPTQFDIIYATYPNQLYAMNHSIQHHHCDAGKLPCFGTNQCISRSKWCDSTVDCLDASDETACSCKARLAESRICDGYIDCPMGSDEMGCFGCDIFQFSCYGSRKEFEASGGSSSLMCYSSIEKCDGFTNCRNGKDEAECSMIVKHFGAMLSYSVSHSEGILHHNFKGRWYPVCKNVNSWAVDACEMEVGKLSSAPFTAVKSIQLAGPFIQPNVNQQNQVIDTDPTFTETCQLGKIIGDENHVMFVKCPLPTCGSSKLFEQTIPTTREQKNQTRIARDAEERIVGGVDAKSMEFPFIVAIYKDGHFHCGGSIYNEHWIITAAHCTRTFENHFYEVRAGVLRRSSYSPSAQISKVSHIIRHPDYERATMKNDIALMKVKHHLSFNRWVRPICVPAKGRSSNDDGWKFAPEQGTMCSTLGWGAVREKGPDPDELKVVDVPIMSKCKYVHDQESNNVCAGETFGTRDACQGDSGGPLVCRSVNNPTEWYLTGIVSHGEGCARANEPGVYTRVALYLDWVIENTNANHPLPSNMPHQSCPGHTCVWGGNKCISSLEKCDGFVDCLGGEDEVECTISLLDLLLGNNATAESNASNATINPVVEPESIDENSNKTIIKKDIKVESFRCTRIPQVINMEQRCDRIFDCEDGSDEDNCTCRDYLRLAFAKLICDGNVDCADSTDELGCLACNATQFACPHSNKCIDKSLHCNGVPDCKFIEDELECLALTDGHSVMLDVNGRPFLHFKGVITQNLNSSWRILCDDSGDFEANGSKIANDVCNVIGFKSAKSSKVVEMTNSHVDSVATNPIDIRSSMIRSKENISEVITKCSALEIECAPFQSNSFAIHPIQHDKIKKNSTIPAASHDHKGHETIFVPVNTTDQKQVILEPVNKTAHVIANHEWNHLLDFDWPWSAEIFSNGDLVGTGILVSESWVLVERNCLGDSLEPLHENHVVAMFGHSKSHLNIQSPYEQRSRVDCLQYVNDSNTMLLHLESPVAFNRHVLPSFLHDANDNETDSKCLAIALNSHKTTKSMELKIIKNCKNQTDLVCYQQAANVTASMKCDGETSHRTSTVVCKTKSNGWYPKAFHQLKRGFCDFLEPISVLTLEKQKAYQQIKNIIDHPCEKCQHHAVTIKCDTHRCPLGKCLDKHQLCDGIADCQDRSDEHEDICHKTQTSCKHSEFRCLDGKCIDKSKFCNHMADCADRTDEPSECTCFSFLRATDPSKLCDGIRHCWDKSDEDPAYCGANCPEMTSFKCGGSAYCVPLEMVCDKRFDCPNGADEEHCDGIYYYDPVVGFGEIMQRSFGIWHTKCFPKKTLPTVEEMQDLCKKLGYKKIRSANARITNSKSDQKQEDLELDAARKNSTVEEISVKFNMLNATKVLPFTKFSAVKVNDGFTVHLRPSKPLAKIVPWDEKDHEDCHRMELECVE